MTTYKHFHAFSQISSHAVYIPRNNFLCVRGKRKGFQGIQILLSRVRFSHFVLLGTTKKKGNTKNDGIYKSDPEEMSVLKFNALFKLCGARRKLQNLHGDLQLLKFRKTLLENLDLSTEICLPKTRNHKNQHSYFQQSQNLEIL